MSKPDFGPSPRSEFDPLFWNQKMGNLFWQTVLPAFEYQDSQLLGIARGTLGQKGYELEFIDQFAESVIKSSSALARPVSPVFNPIEEKIFDFPWHGKYRRGIYDSFADVIAATHDSINLTKARYLEMKEAFMKLGKFPGGLFDNNPDLVLLFIQAAFVREAEGAGALYNRSRQKDGEKIKQAAHRHGLAVIAELASFLPSVEELQIPRTV